MKEIGGHSVESQHLGGLDWLLTIKPSGENYSFMSRVQAHGLVTEEIALDYFSKKENWGKFVINVDNGGEIVKS